MFRHQDWILEWISQVDEAKSWESLQEPGPGILQEINNKIAVGLQKIIHGEFKRRCTVIDTELEKQNKMLNGRQLAWLIYDRNKSSAALQKINNIGELMAVELIGDNLHAYRNDWELALQNQVDDLDLAVAEQLVFRQLKNSEKLKEA